MEHDPVVLFERAGSDASALSPDMPDIGRRAGLVGSAVAVPADASAQDRLLGAMGRQP